jgi:predicted amidohydrolase YtcJ
MSRLEALKSYTVNPAYAAFEEGSKGTLKIGKYADAVVLSKDILTVAESEIPSAEVRYTVVGGKLKYRAK